MMNDDQICGRYRSVGRLTLLAAANVLVVITTAVALYVLNHRATHRE